METKILASFLSGTGLVVFWLGAALAFASIVGSGDAEAPRPAAKRDKDVCVEPCFKPVRSKETDMLVEEQSIILHNAYDLAGEVAEMHQMMRAFDDAK